MNTRPWTNYCKIHLGIGHWDW